MFKSELKQQLFLFLFMLFFFVGCGPKQKGQIKKGIKDVQLQEMAARVTSIPDTPFGFYLHRVIYDENNNSNCQIQYRLLKKTQFDVQSLKESYLADMEIFGWDCLSQFLVENEMVLLFKRPGGVMCQVCFDPNNFLTVTLLNTKKGL